MDDLRKIYTGEKKSWADGSTVIPVLGPEGSEENRAFLTLVCGMDEKALIELWKSKNATPPSRVEQKEWILRFVFTNPGAIAFYPSASVQQVKAILVDGKESSDSSYPVTVQ
jgi:hypothetical protein